MTPKSLNVKLRIEVKVRGNRENTVKLINLSLKMNEKLMIAYSENVHQHLEARVLLDLLMFNSPCLGMW